MGEAGPGAWGPVRSELRPHRFVKKYILHFQKKAEHD